MEVNMTTHDIETRLQNLQPGERLVYARSTPKAPANPKIKRQALTLYERGAVHLRQYRIADFTYDYVAIGAQ